MYNLFRLTSLFVFITLVSCRTYVHISDTEIEYSRMDGKAVGSDAEVLEFIDPFRDEMNEEMMKVIGHMPEDLIKARPNSNMGNWFTDAMLSEAQRTNPHPVDFAIQNYGGLRIPSVAEGPLTKGKIYELMPFDNMLVVLELDNEKIQLLLNKIASSNGWPVSRNLSFRIEDRKAVDIMIHGKGLEKGGSYRVAMPDYIANGGDNCDFLIDVPQDNSGLFIREVIIEHLEELMAKGDKIIIDKSKRIQE
ncbi:MAG: 5'-nucleotidase C-terminal domain-containing protein [Bacteroidia bacterium]|nr:5'-nucleotidase C-terminal domain-containing protein [Bacteroidia bacterium]